MTHENRPHSCRTCHCQHEISRTFIQLHLAACASTCPSPTAWRQVVTNQTSHLQHRFQLGFSSAVRSNEHGQNFLVYCKPPDGWPLQCR